MRHWFVSILITALLLSILPPCAIGAPRQHLMQGKTMGTTYHIKVVSAQRIRTKPLKARIDALLDQLNQSMSTYRENSEISRFNKITDMSQPFAVSDDFLSVMRVAEKIHRLTKGAWDGTVYPLVNLWGFGRSGPIAKAPSESAIARAREKVGFGHIAVSARGHLQKRHTRVTVDLASIAKGYGVDRVAGLLQQLGYTDYLVEIGGEVFAAGRRADGNQWKVGVNRPEKSASATEVYKVLTLQDRAMATSGDYRNFVEIGGKTYSHIIDPRTGHPVSHGVVSATVVAPNCTLADGLATALMVMDAHEGIGLLDKLEGVEGLVIVRGADGSLKDYWSGGLVPKNK